MCVGDNHHIVRVIVVMFESPVFAVLSVDELISEDLELHVLISDAVPFLH